VPDELVILALTAATVGVVHTLLGPDHYVPFLVLARARSWSLRRTLGVTALCGLGHVSGSVLLGIAGIGLGWAATSLEWFESARGELVRARPHSHWHAHGDGEVHAHTHTHHGEHAHMHAADGSRRTSSTAWALFIIFVLGPCEPLVPLLMIPASKSSWWGLAAVTMIFAAATLATMLTATCTLATMLTATWLGYVGLTAVGHSRLERYGHALAGLALVACGLAIRFGL